jgi:hypothetical protein
MRERHTADSVIRRWTWIVALTVAVVAALSAVSGRPSAPRASAPLSVEVAAVPLDANSPERETVGSLRYAGGLSLSSDDPRFGGFSDLRVSEDGQLLRAVSDCGRGFLATLSYDASGRLAGLAAPALYDLTDRAGEPLRTGETDAESLVLEGDRIEVGFEGRGRVWSYAVDPPFGGPARGSGRPDSLRSCGPNAGIETMTLLADGRRLLVCEGRRASSSSVPAWRGSGADWAEHSYPLLFDGGWAGEPFRPTGAARLPGGDVLVVERRFPPIAARVVRLPAGEVAAGAPLAPQEIARIESPLAVDNFEGIDARLDERGRTLVYLLSDDNNCAKRPGGPRGTGLQRTLLLMFVLA